MVILGSSRSSQRSDHVDTSFEVATCPSIKFFMAVILIIGPSLKVRRSAVAYPLSTRQRLLRLSAGRLRDGERDRPPMRDH